MRTVLIAFLFGLFCINVSAAPAAADANLIETVRNAMIQQLLDGHGARLRQETPIDATFVKGIVPDRLGANVVRSATKIAGADFDIESPEYDKDQRLLHVGVWIFSYHDNKTALRKAKDIKGNHFRSKILTHFSNAVVDNKIILVFTESARDEGVANFVKSAPTLFVK
jgi:hypothetical protein